MKADRLTRAQYAALELMLSHAWYDDGWGVVYGGKTTTYDDQPWINYQTAEALERRGVAQIDRSFGRDHWRVKPG